jgi:hypothetical protein
MQDLTAIGRMRDAMRCYRIDQPDSYTVAIYGPDGFCELHDSFAKAFERKEELALRAALRALTRPSKAMTAAGARAMESGEVETVWQAFLEAILAEGGAAGDLTSG